MIKKKIVTTEIILIMLLSSIVPVIPTLAQSTTASMNALEYHWCQVPPETDFVGSEPRELSYHLHMSNLICNSGVLYETKFNVTDIVDWPSVDPETGLYDLHPYPDYIGSDWMNWNLGNLSEGEGWLWYTESLHWEDQERTYSESLDFNVSRTIDQKIIPGGVESIIQNVTIEMRPIESDRNLHAGIVYGQQLIQAELLECNFEGSFSYMPGGWLEWRIEPPLEEVYTFWATFNLTRKVGVTGAVEVIPGGRADSRIWIVDHSTTNHLVEPIEVGTIQATTENVVDWISTNELSKTVFFGGHEFIHPHAHISIWEDRSYSTDGFSVPNEPLDLQSVWSIIGRNVPDSSSQNLHNAAIALDGAFTFRDWWTFESWPDEYLHDPGVAWEDNWWLWYSIPEDTIYGVGFLPEIPQTINEPLGFGSSRAVDKMEFDYPETQHATVTVQVDEDRPPGTYIAVHLFTRGSAVNTEILHQTADPAPEEILPNEIRWNIIEPTIGTYEFSVDIDVDASPGTMFVPGVTLFEATEMGSLPGLPTTGTSAIFENLEMTPEGGSIGNVTVSSSDDVKWTGDKNFARVLDYHLIAEPGTPEEPPSYDPDHLIVASVEEPYTVDPAQTYYEGTAQLVHSVYETLIRFDGESVTEFVPCLATEWAVSPDGLTYTFKIREGVEFHNGEILTPADVEYSFERAMVMDDVQSLPTSPVWMLYEPLFRCYAADVDNWPEDETCPINTAVESNSTHVWFNLVSPYTPFLGILASPWGCCIVNKDFCIACGDWPGTWQDWKSYHNPEHSVLDYPDPVMCGTGPYQFDYWVKGIEYSLVKFDDYWGGWPAPGSDGYVSRVTVKLVLDWEERKSMFLSTHPQVQADIVDVPSEHISELVVGVDPVTGEEIYVDGVRCFQNLDLACTAVFFNCQINSTSPYLGVPGGLPPGTFAESGIPPDFFSDIDVRKAFAYCLNTTQFVEEAFQGEVVHVSTPVIEGLPYYNPDNPKYSLDLLKAEEHFMAAWNGQLWQSGFNLTVAYNTGNVPRQLICEMFKANVESLNPLFHVNIQEVHWGEEYVPQLFAGELPIFVVGWLADYPDPYNFVHPFMYSAGSFALWQSYSNSTVDSLVEQGLVTPDGSERQDIYYTLQLMYYQDAPSTSAYQSFERHWERTWVHGYCYNPFYTYASKLNLYPVWKDPVPNPDEMIVATIGQPMTLDPALAYDTASGELIHNVYETLIFFDREKLHDFVPVLATEVPTVENGLISLDGLTYTFPIRTGVKFHNDDTLTPEDVEYSFERLMVRDFYGGPAWMFYEPLLGLQSSRDEGGNIVVTAEQIDNAITCNATHVTFHLANPYPPFLQILSQFWGSILSKDWCIALGDWPGTWENWQSYNGGESPIGGAAMCGTGPYMFDYWNFDVEWSIVKFDNYWRGWPAPGSEGFVARATVKFVDDWETRKNMFLAGAADSIYVDRVFIDEVLGQPGVRCIYPLPELVCNAMFFTFNISESSPYMGVPGGLPPGTLDEAGIPPDFLSDVDVRKGFAYCVDYAELIAEAYLGEASQPATPVIWGLPFHNPEQEKYSINLTKAQQHFQNAWGGQLWIQGFTMTICYNTGNIIRRMVCEMIKTNIESLNPKFHVNIQEIHWGEEYLPQMLDSELPLFIVGWLADFSDPHNLVFPFMHTRGAFATWQSYSNSTVDALIWSGVTETDVDERQNIYYQLQSIYHEECPSVPLARQRGRRFEREWVQGWYYNPLLYGNYFYSQWKELVPPAQVAPGNNIVDAVETSDTMVLMDTTASGEVSVSAHDINVEGTVPEDLVNVKCVIVDTTLDPDEIVYPIEIRIYYTNEEIISAYVDQSSLRMYYWNETSQEWILEENSGWVTPSDVPGYDGYVWANIYHLSVFTAMGEKNEAPTVDLITAPVDPVQIGTSISATATFTDPNILDMHTATWDWGDGTTSPGTVDEDLGVITGFRTYEAPGVYTVTLTVFDEYDALGTAEFEYVVVYDPEGGFVTGGGWIDSPEGAFTIDPSLTGKATFGFVSKYKKGASTPTGETEFRFRAADLNFHSTSYQWLVVAGARAQFKGYGTIRGWEGEFGFLLTAVDGELPGGGGVDKFRIKIWDRLSGEVIYDNQLGDADDAGVTTAIQGGSIVIHSGH